MDLVLLALGLHLLLLWSFRVLHDLDGLSDLRLALCISGFAHFL